MRPWPTAINASRGALVRGAELVAVLCERSDLLAAPAVTWPEPLPADSPFYDLPNVLLTRHIAGSLGNEGHGMVDRTLAMLPAMA